MKRFYADYNLVKMRQIKELLDDAKIPSFIKNEYIQGASGEIPPHEALPEIWLVDETWWEKAQGIVDELEQDLSFNTGTVWYCGRCDEHNEGQFMVCWKCQQPRNLTES
ncbi:DUF2007 domain-containing protein [Glaciecola petra]|uniref:DUF2007 domain-containing protein n=1 Tax=Glaciecola petra TaxID=3075602 RepID=A0ABU2ZLG0_9ALTE|nr:DUF2007 domain-containing protein [Aestuariibacter sp. P117]MDT0593458.1 DUF2007 domain-containing protein [Aestuariibacter sp. P117]